MKDIKTYLSESCSGKKCKPRKFDKKVFDLIRSGKYKFHDKKLKEILDKASKKIKESLDDDFDSVLKDYVNELEDWVSSEIDNWKFSWDSKYDMENDLDTAQDYFDNNWDEFIDSLIFDGIEEDVKTKIIDALYDKLEDIVDNYVSETEDYANEKYWDD